VPADIAPEDTALAAAGDTGPVAAEGIGPVAEDIDPGADPAPEDIDPGALVRLDAGLLLRLRLRLAGVVRRRWRSGGVLRCLGLLRTANLEVVVDLGDASHLAGQGGGELFGGLRGNGAGECDLALDGGCGDEIVLEGLRSIEGVHDVHFDLSVSALAGWGGCVLRERHNGAEGNNRRPGHDLDETSLEHCRIHLDISSIPAYLPRL
jgi:hypothetical protein